MQELLGARTTHGAGIRFHNHVVESEAAEDALVGIALRLVARDEPLIGGVERVRVLHCEFAPAQEARTRTGFVAVLVLDLVNRERQVFVGRVEVLHHERENFFVRGREQVIGVFAVFQAEDAVSVFFPATGGFVRFLWQQRGEVNFLRTRRRHLFANDLFNFGLDAHAERQPREEARTLTSNVPGANEQLVARNFGVGRVIAQRAQEKL